MQHRVITPEHIAMKWIPSLFLAVAATVGASAPVLAQSNPPGTEPHADGAPGAGPSTKKATTKPKTHAAQPAPGTEPHADGNPGTSAKKPSTKPATKSTQPAPGTEPHADGNPGVTPKK